MKYLILPAFLFVFGTLSAQMRSQYSQYMLNQGLINPGFTDIETRYGGIVAMRKQWMSTGDTPLTGFAGGHYRFTKNHSVGGTVISDQVGDVNTTDVAASYTYHLWLTQKFAIGLGVKMGYQQIAMKNNFVYFDNELDPVLNRTRKAGFNLGTGLSMQSKNFLFGFSMPFLFNNALANSKMTYNTDYNHIYTSIGYKIRFTDNFILYPSAMVKTGGGAPTSMSFDGHFLINQFIWFGGGYRSDNTVALSAGFFLEKGLRIVYTYETAYFSPHKRMDATHEFSINYARSIYESPFSKRQYRKRNGKMYKKPYRR